MKSIKLKLLIFIGMTVIVCSSILIHRTYTSVTSYVENLTNQQLSLALNFDLAIREYVAETIRPMMFNLVGEGKFIPETMSTSFVARSIFVKVRKKFPDYIIKFASGNPRNPVNQASPEELNMIAYFNNNPDNTVWNGEIAMGGREYHATFSAMRMEKVCLRCHGNPKDAPIELIKRYGPDASFYRPLGEVVGMDTIAIPSDTVEKLLLSEKFTNLGVLGMVILLLVASLVFVFKFVITDRLSRITKHFLDAEKQSEKLGIRSIEIKGSDEITTLVASFNKLAKRLNNMHIELTLEIERRKQVQKSLQESEKRFRTVIETQTEMICRFLPDGTLTFVNEAYCRYFSKSHKELIGQNFMLLIPEDDRKKVHKNITFLNQNNPTTTHEHKVINPIGELSWQRWTNQAIFDDQNKLVELQSVGWDITERKNAEDAMRKSEEKYRKLFEMESDALALMDVDTGNMLDVNVSFTKLYGYTKEKMVPYTKRCIKIH